MEVSFDKKTKEKYNKLEPQRHVKGMPQTTFTVIALENTEWAAQVRQVERHRWIIWAPLALAFLIVYFHRVATGVVSDSLMRDFNIARASELGVLSSIYFYTYAALQVPAGIAADRFGPRRTITISAAVMACGAFAFGWAPDLPFLYVARFIIGLGVSFVYINIVKFYADWFRTREFGTMSGLSAFIGMAGSLLAATPLALMVEAVGWRTSFYIIGAATAVVAVYCWIVVRDRPADLGWPSLAEIESSEGTVTPGNNAPCASVTESLRTVWANWYTWPPFLASACMYGVFMALAGVWGVPYFMQVYGMTRVTAANYAAALSLGYMLTGPLLGYLSDRWRCRRLPYVLGAVLIFTGCLGIAVWNGGRPPGWALFPILFIIGAGASAVSLTLACAKEVNPPDMTGMATGTANVGAFVGAALIQPLFGWMLDRRWQGIIEDGVKVYPLEAYQGAFWLCVAILAAGLVFAVLIKETHCANIAHRVIVRRSVI